MPRSEGGGGEMAHRGRIREAKGEGGGGGGGGGDGKEGGFSLNGKSHGYVQLQ